MNFQYPFRQIGTTPGLSVVECVCSFAGAKSQQNLLALLLPRAVYSVFREEVLQYFDNVATQKKSLRTSRGLRDVKIIDGLTLELNSPGSGSAKVCQLFSNRKEIVFDDRYFNEIAVRLHHAESGIFLKESILGFLGSELFKYNPSVQFQTTAAGVELTF